MWLPFIPAFIKYVESHLLNADSIRNYFIVLIVSKVPQRSENNKCRQRPLIVALLQYAYSLTGIPIDRRQVSMRLSRLSKLTARRYIKPPENSLALAHIASTYSPFRLLAELSCTPHTSDSGTYCGT